ncbi:MAG: thioredoxin family protein [Roseobacter sp.]
MSKTKKTRKKSKAPQATAPAPTRRDALKMFRNGGLAIAAAGGAGYWAFGSFRAYAAEHDLSRVGQGSPSIVQIHDPQCPTCTALQKQTRAALDDFDDCGLVYLVADIKTDEGARFAARYGVPHVTLLFFDGQGELINTSHGMRRSAELVPLLAAHKQAAIG